MFNANELSNKTTSLNEPQPGDLSRASTELNKNITVHVMPDIFRNMNTKSDSHKKVGMVIMLAGIILILLIAGAAYYYFFVMNQNSGNSGSQNQEATVPTSTPEDQSSQNTPPPIVPEKEDFETPAKEKYLKYRQEIELITSLEDYDALAGNFGSAAFLEKWAGQYEQIKGLPDKDKVELLNYLKIYQPTRPQLEKELKASGQNKTEVVLEASEPKAIKVKMVFEKADWKVDGETGFYFTDDEEGKAGLEEWLKFKIIQTSPSELKVAPGQDTDNDGLTDAEEILLGLSSDSDDFDGDGYTDYKEFAMLYNPGGPGKLSQNPNIKEYQNSTFSYKLIYPAVWTAEKIGGDESIIIKSKDTQFIQLITSPNTNKEEIEEWYKKQFEQAEINPNSIIEKQSEDGSGTVWRGIKNTNGLIVYITDKQKENIFTFTYNLGQTSKLDYINMFNAMVQSLEITGQ